MRVLGRAAIAAGLLLSTGCFKSYVVVSFEPAALPRADERVAATPALEAARPTLRRLAVRPPYGCAAGAARPAAAGGAGAGLAARVEAVLRSRCDAWVAELPKALAGRFEVVPGRDLALAEQEEGSALAAARKLGADALVTVDELETTPLLASPADPGVARLSAADARGEATGPAALSEKAEASIRRLVAARFPDGALVGVAAAVEVSVVSASTGDLLWSYRRRFADRLAGAREPRLLVRGRSRTWRPVLPRDEAAPPGPAAAGDPLEARLRQLAAALAADVAARFAHPGEGESR